MFTQSDAIRDYIFPLCTIEQVAGGMNVKKFLGSGFFIGSSGFALTAGHILNAGKEEPMAALFAVPGRGWQAFAVTTRELHQSEDVGILRVGGNQWKSIFKVANTSENSACRYRLFGYPEDVVYELVKDGRALIRPDLVYNEGYIRRRVDFSLPTMKGNSFYELSEVAGSGCSGAPITKVDIPGLSHLNWNVVGMYIGEKINDRGTSVGYAVREDAFRDWVPKCLGRSILVESTEGT